MESPRSPKRRRILASINRPEPDDEVRGPSSRAPDDSISASASAPRGNHRDKDKAPRASDADMPTERESTPAGQDTTAPRPTKLRFKSKSSRSSRSRRHHDDDDDLDDRHRSRRHRRRDRSPSRSRSRDRRTEDTTERDQSPRRKRRRRHREDGDDEDDHDDDDDDDDDDDGRDKKHRRRHRDRHRRRHRARSPSQTQAPDPFEEPPLSPETAFRESLFDALADDEGAAYWEAVYGQPVHVYGGALERMSEDEYAAYVRRRMWERTHAGLLEARRRREKEEAERREREAREARERADAARIAREMDRCLRRGEERRRRRAWRDKWLAYVERCKEWELRAAGGGSGGGGGGVERIPWPEGVGRGSSYPDDNNGGGGVQAEAVRAFFVNGLGLEELGEKEFAARLKEERVRWHPDKVQQRLGGRVDGRVMRDVTAVFQVVDALWNDTRKGSA